MKWRWKNHKKQNINGDKIDNLRHCAAMSCEVAARISYVDQIVTDSNFIASHPAMIVSWRLACWLLLFERNRDMTMMTRA